MGITKQQSHERKAKHDSKASGIDWGAVGGGGSAHGVDWGDADPSLTNSLVYAATRRGMAVSFSATANGTGVSVTILDGGDRPKWYANDPEQLDQLLRSLVQLVAEL